MRRRITRYAGEGYFQHRMQWNLSEREVNDRANAIRQRLLKRGINSKCILLDGLDNPFMTEDARKILVKRVNGPRKISK